MKTKSKTTAIVLAFLLGGLGVHKFYLGQTTQGVLYLLFVWTFIPLILSLVDIIMYLTMSDQAFQEKFCGGSSANTQQQVFQQMYHQPYQQPYQQPHQQPYQQPMQPYQQQMPQQQFAAHGQASFCSSCGARVDAGTKFCPSCGNQIV